MTKPRILISEPSATDSVYLPYVTSILKSHWEHKGSSPDAFSWLDPIWLRDRAEGDLDVWYDTAPDIVGLSCYVWNWELQLKAARWAKQRNPNCLVVAGGPDPDYKDPEFFRKYPYIDAIVVKDGEIPFTRILETFLAGSRDFRHIPGLYLPSPTSSLQMLDDPASAHLYTGPAEVPTVFDYSPYAEQGRMYERFMQEQKGRWINATLETNRGCPYSCSYCDWGSATMAKVRKFEMVRVETEVEWLARIGVNCIILADANFGILPRDLDIAKRLAEAREKHGYPTHIYYSSAKNNPDRTVEIAKRTYDAKLTLEHVLAVQHTDGEVLAGTDRANIPAARYREVVAKLAVLGISSEVQVILGIPGDTVDKWKNCLAELMEWGVHDNYQVSPYTLLPNAPAAEPKFKAKWQMDTVDRQMVPCGGIREKNSESLPKSKIVVGWRGFSREDWLEVSTYTAFVRAYHNRALTRLPAIYLHFVHGVSYREYYEAVVDEFCRHSPVVAPLYRRVRKVYEEFLADPEASDVMELEDFPDCTFMVDPAKWVYTKTSLQLDGFYGALSSFLVRRFPQGKNLRSAIKYQKQLVILPEYDSNCGKSFLLDRDWPSFFQTARVLMDYSPLDEPASFLLPRHARLAEEDRQGRDGFLDFGSGSLEERRNRWLIQTIRRSNVAEFSNHRDPCISTAGASLLRIAQDFTSECAKLWSGLISGELLFLR
jgi:putative methyltransferase